MNSYLVTHHVIIKHEIFFKYYKKSYNKQILQETNT